MTWQILTTKELAVYLSTLDNSKSEWREVNRELDNRKSVNQEG